VTADPDHLVTDRVADPARWPAVRDQPMASRSVSLLAPTATVDLVLVGMDQQFGYLFHFVQCL
jgi:hypothetical protein